MFERIYIIYGFDYVLISKKQFDQTYSLFIELALTIECI